MREDYSADTARAIFTKYLTKNNHRKTPERFAILECIYSQNGHFNAEILHNTMKKEYRVSLATIYNTLDLLQACQLVVKHQFGDQIAQYEKTFGNTLHNHLVCTTCGKVKEFSDKKVRTLIQNKKFAQFNISHYSLYLYGTCGACKIKLGANR